jgi:hypothetical protein
MKLKSRILIFSVVLVSTLTSCAGSHCNINKWRCRRYVETKKLPIQNSLVEKPAVVIG